MKTVIQAISDVYESFEAVEARLAEAREQLNGIAAQFGFTRTAPPLPQRKPAPSSESYVAGDIDVFTRTEPIG